MVHTLMITNIIALLNQDTFVSIAIRVLGCDCYFKVYPSYKLLLFTINMVTMTDAETNDFQIR